MHLNITRFFSHVLSLATALLLAVSAQAQTTVDATPHPCGTDQAMRELLGAGYEQWWSDYRAQLQTLTAAHRNPPGSPPAGPRFIVPVVVHIIHDGGASNISDEQVYDAIRITNEVFQELDPDTSVIIPYFKPRIGNANIEFRLAKLDPNGNCTTGITRHLSALTQTAGENVKNLPGARWNQQRYLNVWVVENIASGAGGYAYFPCSGGTGDGIVLRNAQFGSIGRSSRCGLCMRALPHEIGHYLGLPHTWGGTNTPGLPSNCSDDDGIDDTPNTVGANGCNLSQAACSGDPSPIANVQNIMDYACQTMFTQGQASVMNDGVNLGGFSCRQQLVSVANHTATGIATGQVIPPCLPIAYVTAFGARADSPVQRLCAGDSIRFRGEVYNLPPGTPVTWQWRFPGGLSRSSTSQTPFVTYPTPGLYSVSLTVTSAAGADSVVQTRYVR
ncbi:MAG: PKD domain-containing protein, partial [Hymenobacteraceae bacterium]|nr:PKD domain-containing protein [Hymenobacteraceae bacterium]